MNTEKFIVSLHSLSFEQLIHLYKEMCSGKRPSTQHLIPRVESDILRRYYLLKEKIDD